MFRENGNALLNAIVVAGVVAGISAIILTQVKVSDESSRGPRIHAAMAAMQARVQALASNPNSYTCTATGTNNLQASCNLKPGIFTGMSTSVTGAQCPPSGQCGVYVMNPPAPSTYAPNFANGTRMFTAWIAYGGTEMPIAPIQISYKIPTDVTAAVAQLTCATDPNNSLFGGYDNNGNIICNPLPTNCMVQGFYITSVDPNKLTPTCNQLGAANINCPLPQYLSDFSWNAGAHSFNDTCAARPDPFVKFPYSNVGGVATLASLTPVYTAVTTSTTTSTTTSSTTTTTIVGVTTTTMAPPSNWNCYDGYAGGAAKCNTGIDIVDDGSVSGTNPGSAWIKLTWNGANGDYNQQCQCSAGTLTPVSCDSGNNREYYTCAGGSGVAPKCSWGTASGGFGDPGPYCNYSIALAGWSCVAHGATPAKILPCPGHWNLLTMTAKGPGFTWPCHYSAPINKVGSANPPDPTLCASPADAGANALCGYGSMLYNFQCVYP